VCAVVLGAVQGCAGTGAATPGAALSSFAEAIRQERFDVAYGLMAESYRERVSRDEFERHLRENPAEAHRLAARLSEPEGPIIVTARVPYADDALQLIQDGKTWHLEGNVVDFYDQSSPRTAIRSFVRAMENRRYDVVLRFVPNADREGMSVDAMREAWEGEGREEIERLLANLRANLNNPIEVVGDRATMPYGERFSMQLVREDGVWKVEDPD
jgi:glutathione S-transferase